MTNNVSVAKNIAEKQKLLREIYVPTDRTQRIVELIDQLAAVKQADVGGDHSAALIYGDSHSGKSSALKHAIKMHGKTSTGAPTVMLVTLPPAVTRRSMLLAIGAAADVEGFFDPTRVKANEYQLQKMICRMLENLGTSVLVLDEAHHIQYGRANDAGKVVGELIKTCLIEGPCPIVLCGAGSNAKRPFLENRQLANRTIGWFEVKPFDIQNEVDRSSFKKLFHTYFHEMLKKGIIGDGALLRTNEFFKAFFRASEGKPGEAVRIIEGAVADMVRAGRASFAVDDFHKSTERLALTAEHNMETPFASLLAG